MSTPQFELVNSEAHKDIRINTGKFDIVENKVNAAVVVAGELSTLIHEYPIFISKNPETNEFQLIAILGLHSGENLFLQGEVWRAKHLPLDVLRKPFQAFIPDPKNRAKGSIAIDIDNELVRHDKGELLFTETGEATEYFKRIEAIFSQLMGGTMQTATLLQQAADLNLLEEIGLNFDLADGKQASLNGLFAFNKENVSALKGKDLERCHESGVLQICHLVLSSATHLDKLIKWHADK
ncbi:MAG: SapC family protein [Gammaproteobacteria bacterium]|nr:SapC family protein [Gammaproteobacteria bacterium]